MSTKVKLTPAQRVALGHVRQERVRWYPGTEKLATLGQVKRVQLRTVEALIDSGLVEVVYRGTSGEGILILTDVGRDALGAK